MLDQNKQQVFDWLGYTETFERRILCAVPLWKDHAVNNLPQVEVFTLWLVA